MISNLQTQLPSSQTEGRLRDVALLVVVSILILSFIWGWQHSFRGSTAVFAIALIGVLASGHVSDGTSLRDAGFRLDTLVAASKLLAPLTVLVLASVVFLGHLLGSARFPTATDAVPSLIEAFAFGLVQQYVLLGFFYRRLERLLGRNALTIVATAAVFSLFHLPNPFLSIVTLIAGSIATLVYRRAPNLWVNGIAHGLISYHLYYALPLKITGGLHVGPGFWAH